MVDWLIRKVIRDGDVSSPGVRERCGLATSVICICCNTLLCLVKGAIGFAMGSVAVVADAANNLTDGLSNVVGLLGFKLASRPPDAGHPYGHGRYEYLASLVVAILVILVGVESLRSAYVQITDPVQPDLDAVATALLVASVLVKLWMMRLNARMGERIASQALRATAVDSRNDALTTSAVLLSLLVTRVSGVIVDGWMGLAVGAFIVWSGISLVRDTVDTLLGRAPDPELVARVRERILRAPEVLGMHDLMIHDYGPGRQFASAHVEMAPEGGILEYHAVLDAIERDLWERERLVITLHLDPIERKGEGREASEAFETLPKDGFASHEG